MPVRIVLPGLYILIALLSVPAQQVSSCPIPVYRYALEFWEPDPYRVTIYSRGALSPSEQALFNRLTEHNTGPEAYANVDFTHVDLEINPHTSTLLPPQLQSMHDDAFMVVQYPRISARSEPVWSGPFSREYVDRLLDSPVRQTIAHHLAEGTMVWILLQSGNRADNRQALSVLQTELARLEQTLVLPDPEQWWTNREGMDPPEIRFEIVPLPMDDPAEQPLIQMLLHSEDDLLEFQSEPMVFPLYGRGIALWGIVGSGINTWNITDAAEFLTGPCSCQVKMLNPGVDLLVVKDWEASVERIADAMLTPITGFSEFEERGQEFLRRLEEQDGQIAHVPDFAASGRRPTDHTSTLSGAPDNTLAGDHTYTDIFDELADPEGSVAPVTPQTGGAAMEQFHLRLIAILTGIMILAGIAGFVLFRVAGKEKRSNR